MAIVSWKERAERASARLARFREESKSAVVNTRHNLETVAAAGLAGAVRGAVQATGKEYAIPGPGGMKVPPELVVGGFLLGIAYSGQTDVSRDLHAAGSGIIAYSAGREAEQFMMKRGTKPPGTVQ